jgi:hypothetical protein
LALTLALGGCGGGGGDQTLPRSPDVRGSGARLAELNDPANPRPSPDDPVLVTGVVVTAIDEYDETADGSSAGNAFAQDLAAEAAAYSGITLFDWNGTPPAFRPAPGDVVDVRGKYEEFTGPAEPNAFDEGETLPEISGASVALRFEHEPPEPRRVPLADLASYETGRRWIGVLARIENVRLYADGSASSSGRFSAKLWVEDTPLEDLPSVTNALFDLEQSGVELTAGTELGAVVGVVEYFYAFSIAPRSAADLEPGGRGRAGSAARWARCWSSGVALAAPATRRFHPRRRRFGARARASSRARAPTIRASACSSAQAIPPEPWPWRSRTTSAPRHRRRWPRWRSSVSRARSGRPAGPRASLPTRGRPRSATRCACCAAPRPKRARQCAR